MYDLFDANDGFVQIHCIYKCRSGSGIAVQHGDSNADVPDRDHSQVLDESWQSLGHKVFLLSGVVCHIYPWSIPVTNHSRLFLHERFFPDDSSLEPEQTKPDRT